MNNFRLIRLLGESSQTVEKPLFAVNLTLSVRAFEARPAPPTGEPRVKLFHITIFFDKKRIFRQSLALWERCRTK